MSASPALSHTMPQPSLYPSTFSAEMVEHCRQGCIPPEVFADAQALLHDGARLRYVRVNPRSQSHVCAVGVEGVLRLKTLSAVEGDAAVLAPDEQALACELQPIICAAFATASASSSPSLPVVKAALQATVPMAALLRLGVSGLTGVALDQVQAVPWLPVGVFALPWSYAMGSSALFKDGTLVAMDAASIAAVVALRPRRGDRVVDLCCAPGMKLGLVADAVADSAAVAAAAQRRGLAVGVDVSLPRLYMSRANLIKQQFGEPGRRTGNHRDEPPATLPVCLFRGDGRCFSVPAALSAFDAGPTATVETRWGLTAKERRRLQRGCSVTDKGKRSRSQETVATAHRDGQTKDGGDAAVSSDCSTDTHVVYAPAEARRLLQAWKQESDSGENHRGSANASRCGEALLFDRVLVDAECSHDGSVAHLQLDDCDIGDGQESKESRGELSALTIEKGRGVTNAYRMQRLHLEAAAAPPSAPAVASALSDLQLALLCRGYALLKPGGTLVYSTCSYAVTQDELVLQRFLARVNTPQPSTLSADGAARVTAVVVPAFSYDHEALEGSLEAAACADERIAPCVRLDSREEERRLQSLLDAHHADYGVVAEGARRYRELTAAAQSVSPATLGSRFWPKTFACSFLYVAKIWKRVDTA